MNNSNLIIIGSGPGGYRAAEHAAKHGLSVTIFEANEAGGTCLNCGCIPTKTFCRNAEIMQNLHEGDAFGLQDVSYNFDFNQVLARKQSVVEALRSGVEGLLAMPGITLVRGKAEFKDAKTVVANGEEYTADNIIIATGSRAKLLPIEGIDLPHVVTSTELLNIPSVPKRLCIVGAGVIGMEFASIFNSFGSQVTVVEFLKECLPAIDSDIAKRLRQSIGKRGVTFHMQAAVKRITCEGVYFERKGKEEMVEADVVLIATGRAANTEGIGLEQAGVEFDRVGIKTDDNMQTNIPHIYAIGDVNARCMLAHAATFQGLRAVNHILGKSDNIRLDIMPSAIFTLPEAAGVGLTEEQCKEQGLAYVCKKSFHRANGKALAMHEGDGMLKLLAGEDGKIIGCYAYGAHAADLVQEASALMCKNTTVKEMSEMVHIHPTLSEVLHSASEQF
ncbi:MAG: dihydrolipoyl dehydrogenase [Prevotella sp.]|nr:dihydrolipoyl dehydrogenase [Prevotella sp.]